MLPLTGFTIGITGHRRAAEQAEMLVERGADVVLGPVVESVGLDDTDATARATEEALTAPVDLVVLTTGAGTRSWLGVAARAGLDESLRTVCAEATVLACGPEARSAAIAAGLEVSWQAPGAMSAEILAHLMAAGVAGKRIVVQLDGGRESPAGLAARLRERGAEVVEVPVCRWQPPADIGPPRRLISAIVAGRVDAVTFTSAVAVDHLFELARREHELLEAFAGPARAVSLDPVTAAALHRRGVERVVVPEHARLGSMVQALVSELSGLRRVLVHGSAQAIWQGSALHLPGAAPTVLTSGERRLLETLVARAPAVVPKAGLVGRGSDVHAAEVAVARLRNKLGPLGQGIRTVPRRGYRCELTIRPLGVPGCDEGGGATSPGRRMVTPGGCDPAG